MILGTGAELGRSATVLLNIIRTMLARGRVGAAGAAHGEPVQRAIGAQVCVVPAVQLRAQIADLWRVLGGCRLRIEQRPDRVAQPGQRPEFAGLAAGYLVRPFGAVEDPGERPVVQGPDVAVGLGRPGRGRLRLGSGSGRRGCPGESARLVRQPPFIS